MVLTLLARVQRFGKCNALQTHRLRANRSLQHTSSKCATKGATACNLADSAPIEPPSTKQNSLSPRYRMTRHSPYRGNKLSRLALPSELIECHSPSRIRSLAKAGAWRPCCDAIDVDLFPPDTA